MSRTIRVQYMLLLLLCSTEILIVKFIYADLFYSVLGARMWMFSKRFIFVRCIPRELRKRILYIWHQSKLERAFRVQYAIRIHIKQRTINERTHK